MASRRAVLAALTGGTAAVAGCASLPLDTTEPYRLTGLSAVSTHDEPHDVGVTLVDDEETVLDETVSLPAADEVPGDDALAAQCLPLPGEPGRFVLRARLDGDARTTRLDPYESFSDGPAECMKYMLRIHGAADLDVWYSSDCRPVDACRDDP